MMSTDLERIQNRIDAGDTEGARRALVSLLRGNPQNAAGWMLLATLFDEPARQADCYRQVLRIDPDNQRAASQLRALTGHPRQPPPQEKPVEKKDGAVEKKETGYTSRTTSTQREAQPQGFFGRLFSKKEGAKEKFIPLSPDEIIELAGGALPPEERRQCPNPSCGAVIPKDTARCPWCGQSL